VAAILLDNTGAEWDIILHQWGGGLQRIFDRQPAYDPLHFPLPFPHGELGWHLAVWYQDDATSRRVLQCKSAADWLYIKANGYSRLHRPARLFLCEVSTLTTLPGRAPADYIHQKLPPYWQGHLQPYSLHSIQAKVNSRVINVLNTIKCGLTVTLQTNTTVKMVPVMPTKCVTAKVKLNKEPVSLTVTTETSIYFHFNFCASSNSPKSCNTALH
jgi:hypothetical protein